MAFKFNPFTARLDYYDPGISLIGNPVTVDHGGTGNTSYAEGAIPFYDTDTNKLEGDATNFSWNEVYTYALFNGLRVLSGATVQLYVDSVSGSDANTGLAAGAGNAKLTLDGTNGVLSIIPMLGSGKYQINIANGTYNLAAEYEFKPFFASAGDSDNRTVISLVGDAVTPSNVIINAASTATNAFVVKGRLLLVKFDGFQIKECAGGIKVDGGFATIANVDIINFRTFGIQYLNNSIGRWEVSAAGGLLQCNSGSNAPAVSIATGSSFTRNRTGALTITQIGNNSAFVISGFGSWTDAAALTPSNSTLSISGNAGSVGAGGIFIGSFGTASFRGVINIDGFNLNSISTGIQVAAYGSISFAAAAGIQVNLSNCRTAVQFNNLSFMSVGVSDTWSFGAGITTNVKISQGAIAGTITGFGVPVTYVAGLSTNAVHGYDDRYIQRTGAGIYAGTSTAGTDAYVGTTSPTIASATTGMTVSFTADVGNTGAASFNLNSIGAQPITKRGAVTLEDGDIVAGMLVVLQWDAGKWEMMNPTAAVRSVADGGTGTGTAFTAGSVVFAGTSGVYTQDNSSLFFDDTNNRLGIGTAAPFSKLHVAISSSDTALFNSLGQEGLCYQNTDSTVNNWENLVFKNATAASPGQASAAIAVQNLSHVTQSGRMILATGQAGTLIEVMRLTENSRVGIGQTNPSSQLHISPASGSDGSIRLSGGSSLGQGSILMGASPTGSYDTNLTQITNNNMTMGFIGSSDPTSSTTIGAFINFRGPTYTAIASQRGALSMGAFASVGTPAAGSIEGCLIMLHKNDVVSFRINPDGQKGMGISNTPTAPTAVLHLGAGTATASTAPLKFTSGTNLTTAEAGAMEFDGTNLYFSPSTVRKTIAVLQTAQTFSANQTFSTRLLGSSIAATAANDLTLGQANEFIVAGNTQINAITTSGWTAGSKVTLIFSGTPTVKHNNAGGAGTAVLLLAGSADFVAAANSVLGLEYDGTEWQETFRKVA